VSIAQDRLARTMMVRRKPSTLVHLTRAAPGALSQRSLPLIVQWSFLLFIALIAAEVSSLTKLCGLLFFASYFFYHNPLSPTRSFPPVPRVMLCFLLYLAVYGVNGFFLSNERLGEFVERFFQLVQLMVFFWIASDILKDHKIAKKALLAYSVASVILALGLVLSLPGFHVSGEIGSERASLMGQNANWFAYVMALAVVALIGLWLNLSHKGPIQNGWMLGSISILSLAVVYTGSRGGVVMLMVGLSVYLIPYWKNRWRISASIIAFIAMAGLAYMAATTPFFVERWEEFTEGQESTRDRIKQEAFDMISERPLLGWQPIEFRYELGRRTDARTERDAHNLYLHVLMEVGLLGSVPFLIGLGLCGKAAWKARNQTMGLVPFALWVTVLAGAMTSASIYMKAVWFVLAVTVAARGERRRPGMILVAHPLEDGTQASSSKLSSSTPGVVSEFRIRNRSLRTSFPREY
jgi:O-antigen ligase